MSLWTTVRTLTAGVMSTDTNGTRKLDSGRSPERDQMSVSLVTLDTLSRNSTPGIQLSSFLVVYTSGGLYSMVRLIYDVSVDLYVSKCTPRLILSIEKQKRTLQGSFPRFFYKSLIVKFYKTSS